MMLDLAMKCTSDDAVSINHSIMLIINYFNNRLLDYKSIDRCSPSFGLSCDDAQGMNDSPSSSFRSLYVVAGRFQWFYISQDCLGRPILRLQSPEGPNMQAWRARWWSCQGSAQLRWPKRKDDGYEWCRTGLVAQYEWERISSLLTKSDQCTFRMHPRHDLRLRIKTATR